MGFPGGSDSKESACNAGDLGLISLVQKDLLEKGMATNSSILPGEFHGQRSLVGYSLWGHKKVERDLGTKQQQLVIAAIGN